VIQLGIATVLAIRRALLKGWSPPRNSTPIQASAKLYLTSFNVISARLRIVEQAAGHLRWKVDYPPSQPVGSGFEPLWRPQPAKLPLFGGYSLETLPYLQASSKLQAQSL